MLDIEIVERRWCRVETEVVDHHFHLAATKAVNSRVPGFIVDLIPEPCNWRRSIRLINTIQHETNSDP